MSDKNQTPKSIVELMSQLDQGIADLGSAMTDIEVMAKRLSALAARKSSVRNSADYDKLIKQIEKEFPLSSEKLLN